ncbi:MFS transporter [Lutimaribacter sp. EGI FJ00015]|uniref:MFS transporter n=1 Tax=Lutimaribacter degradans TaxID=2945989 RepID=A0ACC5ZVU5_9RHOB|nr:MFS transporter [Lutimaribacter sp. EGI FJ00013]MCM2561669.1 MFS transporter [Lutimaribacter sp. EGI FJ00013]MCO0612619.1 MFS transporter [Lutimaribacter sp. EGI FJ00015]MCO0635277.1 MFS transporter [Lutimaribacter sp. EGI FJ00014]
MNEGARQNAILGVGFVLIYQTAVVAAVQTAPVLAPFAALGLGLDADLIGLFTAIIFAMALVSSTGTAGVVARWGSFRGASASLVVVALGALALALAQGPVLVLLGAVLIGVGYGPVNPIGSRLLNKIAVGRHRNLVFSFKQSSVAIGGAAAGFILPVIVLVSGWRMAALATMALALAVAALSPLVGKRLGQDGLAGVSIRFKLPFAPARDVLADPMQRGLAIGVFAFSMAQFGFMSVYIAMIWRESNLPPEGAAAMLSLTMTASICGRLYWGWRADRGRPRHVLSWLAWSGAALLLLLLFLGPSWPWAAIALVSVGLGFGPMGWSGVLLAEVARAGEARGGPGGVLTATAGSMVFAYLGGLFGPALLSISVLLSGSYTPGIVCLAVAFAVCAVVVVRGTETSGKETNP